MASQAPDYIFTRDYVDNNRINLQHYQWIALFGYLVHPAVSTDKADLRVADVGTGTAVWLTQLASYLPQTAQLDGLDVSFSAAPHALCLPANVTLRHWDIREPVPRELLGVYDVVHVRNLIFVLRDEEVPPVLERLVSLLRPGGALQWGENDVSSFRIAKVDPEVPTSALTRLMAVSKPQDDRLNPTWMPQLPILFRDVGLNAVEEDVREAPPHLELAMHECILAVHGLIAEKSKNQDVMKTLRDLMPQVQDETRQGAYWSFTRRTVVGKKKMQEQ